MFDSAAQRELLLQKCNDLMDTVNKMRYEMNIRLLEMDQRMAVLSGQRLRWYEEDWVQQLNIPHEQVLPQDYPTLPNGSHVAHLVPLPDGEDRGRFFWEINTVIRYLVYQIRRGDRQSTL